MTDLPPGVVEIGPMGSLGWTLVRCSHDPSLLRRRAIGDALYCSFCGCAHGPNPGSWPKVQRLVHGEIEPETQTSLF